jgi:(E)-4-hydroxy-3-methylbut-2-enyl-diphosphate synthase
LSNEQMIEHIVEQVERKAAEIEAARASEVEAAE